jgi:FkbM family methyltransferase
MEFWSDVDRQTWKTSSVAVIKNVLSASSKSIFLDIGAWIGPQTLFGANFAKQVFAVEPDPWAFSALNANLRLNPALESRTRIFHECILDKSNPQVKMVGSADGSSRVADVVGDAGLRGGASWPVKCRSLKDFINQEGINTANLALISLDVSGLELDILSSMSSLLKGAEKPAILLSVHKPAWKTTASLKAAWEFATSYQHIYQFKHAVPLAESVLTSASFCEQDGCVMLLSDAEYK